MIGSSSSVPTDPATQKTLPQILRTATATPKAAHPCSRGGCRLSGGEGFSTDTAGFGGQQSIRRIRGVNRDASLYFARAAVSARPLRMFDPAAAARLVAPPGAAAAIAAAHAARSRRSRCGPGRNRCR